MKDKEFDGFYKYKREHNVEVTISTIAGRLTRGETNIKKLAVGPDDYKIALRKLKEDGLGKEDIEHFSIYSIKYYISKGYTVDQVCRYVKEDIEQKPNTAEAIQAFTRMMGEPEIKIEKPNDISIRACIIGNMTVDEIAGGTDGWEHYKRRIEEHVKSGEIVSKATQSYTALLISNICTKSVLTRAVEELQNEGRIGRYATKEEIQRKLDEYDRLDIKASMLGAGLNKLNMNTLFDDITAEDLEQLESAVTGHDKVYVADNGSVIRCRVRLLKSLVDKYGANKYKKDIFDEAKKAFIKEYQRQQKYHRNTMRMAPLSMYKLDSILLLGSYEAEVIVSLKSEVEEAMEQEEDR